MGFAIHVGSWLLWLPLQVLVISALLRVGVRRYPLIFAYLTVTFLVAAIQAPISFRFVRGNYGRFGNWYQTVNTVGDSIGYVLILCVVLTFIYRATSKARTRRLVRTVVTAGAALLMLISFLIHYRAGVLLGVWMAPMTRDIHFGAAILDLAVWGMLVASHDRDSRLLLLTGGMGIMFAGEAVAAALRSISIPIRSVPIYYSGHILKVLTNAAFLYVWWQTFRNEAVAREREAGRAVANGQ